MNDLLARSAAARAPSPSRSASFRSSRSCGDRRSQAACHRSNCGAAPGCRVADPVRLEQAITHLVQNAIDASPRARGAHPVRADGGEVSIDVIDSGTGMSAEFVRTRLFQPFASTKDGGFGIGAYEARSLVAAMGGRIEVESREGEAAASPSSSPPAKPRRRPRSNGCAHEFGESQIADRRR
jgi:signal transduction histidine kinase